MARVRPLSSAPIQEALIDLVFTGASLSKEDLQSIARSVAPQGWIEEQIDSFEAEFNHSGADGGIQFRAKARQFDGFSISSPSRDRIFQVRTDRITASHVRAYESWERLSEDAATLFSEFVKRVPSAKVSRMAARFINRLKLPPGFEQRWAEILTRPPLAPEGVTPVGTPVFLSRQVLNGLTDGLTANVAVGTGAPIEGEELPSLVVDVDVFKLCDEEANFSAIEGQLEEIRHVKNALFFGSLHELPLEPYQ